MQRIETAEEIRNVTLRRTAQEALRRGEQVCFHSEVRGDGSLVETVVLPDSEDGWQSRGLERVVFGQWEGPNMEVIRLDEPGPTGAMFTDLYGEEI